MKNTRKISIALVIVMVLMMAMAVIPASAEGQPATLYLTPNANWKSEGARFAAYFFDNGETWVDMTDSNGDGIYEVAVPTDKVYPKVIFCRMNPNAAANNWNNKWNQTADLTIPTTGPNHFAVKEGTWDKGGGTWSTLGSNCQHTNLGDAATCTTPQVCLDCKDPVVSALGHTFNASHLCTRCNEQASFTVAGTGAHLGTEWDTGNTANDMIYADGVYTKVYENVAAGSYKFKVARDHDFGTAYPSADKAYTVDTAGSTVTITLKGTTVEVVVTPPAPACEHEYMYSCDAHCMKCGELTNPDASHTVVHVEAKAGTDCQTFDGNIEYWACEICGGAWSDEALTQPTNRMNIIVAGDHQYWSACDANCMVCGELTNPDASHNAVHVEAKAGTDCQTYDGNVEYWACETCGGAWSDEALTYPTNRMNIVAVGAHNFVEGVCSVCNEADPDYVAPVVNDFLINFSNWEEFPKETYADGDVVKYNDIFTFIMGKNSRVDGSSKTWDDFSGTLRFSLGGKTNDGVPTKNAIQITVDGAYTLKIWYVAGGDGRYFELRDAEGNALSTTTKEILKNGQDFAELSIPAAGTYYVTIPNDNNYFFQIELVKAAEAPECEHDWVDATCAAPKTCSKCQATEGEALAHNYFYNVCLACLAPNPYFENNFTTVGDNKLVCNEYHLVDTDTHLKPYQFTFVTIPEDGHYIFTADPTKLSVFIYTIPFDENDAEGWVTGGPNWSAVTFGEADLKAGVYYLGFIFQEGQGEYNLTITKAVEHEHTFVEGKCECGEEDPTYVPPHEHEFVEGKCECGAEDPNYVAPEQPGDEPGDEPVVEPELNFFQKIWKAIVEFFERLLAMFKK